jgi:nitroreductase
MRKRAPTDHPVLDEIAERWSPRAFEPAVLHAGELQSLFEAARWAASSRNEQPWSFLVARREDEAEFGRALACLADRNRLWAKNAGALIFSLARREFSRDGKPNRHAAYDLGQAVAHLALEATHLGLAAHQMAGFSPDAVRANCGVPEEWEPMTAIAVGRPGRVEDLDETFREAETAERTRRPIREFVMERRWGQSALLG